MAVLDDLKILLDTDDSKDPLLTLYIRKAMTLISLYLNVPIVTTPDARIVAPTQPMETIVFPDTPVSVITDDGTNTISVPTNIEIAYPDAIIEYVIICMNKKGKEGLKQFSQGSRSGTYGSDLPDSVIALLPVPYITMLKTKRADCNE